MVNKKHSREVALVRAILLLAVVFATIAFIRDVNLTGLVASENISNELPVWTGNNTWEINKNSNLIVDLNDYFSDPNNDTLTYLATTADKISIAIEDNMLTITPAPDFAGERTISIIASDEFETITVNVKIIIGSEEERALSPVNESDITQISNASEENISEELNITEEINISEEINITEVNISEELDTNVSSEPLETDSNISIKKFSVDEEIKDENEKYVGKKIEDEEIFETFFTKLEKNESGLLVAFYHNSSTEQPIWIEESINYTLSKTTALPLEEITLIVPKIKGIIPKFKLHIGPASEIFEFGKTIPEIIFNGNSTLIDRDDEKIDVELINKDSKAEIIGIESVEFINAKIDSTSNEIIKTKVFSANNLTIDNATIILEKNSKVNTIMECPDFNLITDSCPSQWIKTDIPFEENQTHIKFIVTHFSGYGGAEIEVLNIQSYPMIGSNWTVMFNTTGTANLTISAINGTVWSNVNEDYDLKFLEIKCGDNILNYSWINNSVFIENYNCSETGYETSRVITQGKHSLKFEFGDSVAYAFNQADAFSEHWSYRLFSFDYDETYTEISIYAAGDGVGVDSQRRFTMGITQRTSPKGSFDPLAVNWDWRLIQYDENGTQLRNTTANFDSNDSLKELDVDSSDNIVVVGDNSKGGNSTEMYIAKYNSTFSMLWNFTWDRDGLSDNASKLAIDTDNNITVIGNYLIKFNSTGSQLWNVSVTGNDVDTDSNDNIIVVAGKSNPSEGSVINTTKFDLEGTELWHRTWNESGNAAGHGIAVDNSDNIIVVGAQELNDNTDNYFWAIVKYDSDGTQLWNHSGEIGNETNTSAYAVAVDSSNNITVTGTVSLKNQENIKVFNSTYDSIRNNTVMFTATFNSTGTQIWNSSYYEDQFAREMSGHYTYGKDVVIDNLDNIGLIGSHTPNLALRFKFSRNNTHAANTTNLAINVTGGNLTCWVTGNDTQDTNLQAYWIVWHEYDGETYVRSRGITDITAETPTAVLNTDTYNYGMEYTCTVKMFDGTLLESEWNAANDTIDGPACGTTLNADRIYVLTDDLTTSGTCFTLGGNNVTLDCNGHSITGDTSGTDYTVYDTADRNNFLMKNCKVNNFYYPLYNYFTNSVIYNNTFNNSYTYLYFRYGSGNNISYNNFTNSRYSSGGAVSAATTSSRIENNHFFNNAGFDIRMDNTGVVFNNTHNVNNKNKSTVFFTTVNAITVENNTIYNQGTGANSWAYDITVNSKVTFKGNNYVDGQNATEYFLYNQNNRIIEYKHHNGSVHVLNIGEFAASDCNNLTIRFSNFTNHYSQTGNINLRNVDNSYIYGNNISRILSPSLTDTMLYTYSCENLSIYNNEIKDSTSRALYLNQQNGGQIYNNNISAGTSYSYPNGAYGIHLYNGGPEGVVCGNMLIYNNNISGGYYGIYADGGAYYWHAQNVTFFNNSISGMSYTGIRLEEAMVVANNNTVVCNNDDIGIELSSSSVVGSYYGQHSIENNTIRNCKYGIATYYGSGRVHNNNITTRSTASGTFGIVWGTNGINYNISRDNIVDNKSVPYYWQEEPKTITNQNFNLTNVINTGLTLISVKDFIINNSNITNDLVEGTGIYICNSNNTNITNNKIINFEQSIASSYIAEEKSENPYIAHNKFENSSYGVRFSSGNDEYYNRDWTIYNNTFYNIANYAIERECYASGNDRETLMNITSNIFNYSSDYDIYLTDCDNNTIAHNTFDYSNTYSLYLFDMADSVIDNNRFINHQGTTTSDRYIFLYLSETTGNNITNNYLNGSGYGIYYDSTGGSNPTYNNEVYNAAQAGFYTDHTNSEGIYNNTVCHNTKAIYFAAGTLSSIGWHNNSFCIVNINPANGSTITDTFTPWILFNATNIVNTSCTAIIDNIQSGTNDTLGSDNTQQSILTNRTLSESSHILNITCSDSYDDSAVPNSITFDINISYTPVVNSVILNTSSNYNTTAENLTLYYNTSDADNEPIKNITNWYMNYTSITVLNMPFDSNLTAEGNTKTRDYSPYGKNGTVTNARWNSTGGYDGYGVYEFDGTGDYISVGSIGNYNQTTIVFWMKARDIADNSEFHGLVSSDGWEEGVVHIAVKNSIIDIYLHEGGTDRGRVYSPALSNDIWYHVAVSADVITDEFKLYINGKINNTDTISDIGTEIKLISQVIGRENGNERYFDGFIDEVAIYTRALTPEQIWALYKNRTDIIVSNETKVGEVWHACLTPTDSNSDGNTACSNNVTILLNAAPLTNNIFVNSTYGTNLTTEDLTCWINASDFENTSLIAYYNWYNNSVQIPSLSGSTGISANALTNISTLSSTNTSVGENWTCEVKAWDGTDNETVWNNASLIILNTAPNITQIFINSSLGTNYTTEDITCWVNTSDLENTTLLIHYNWYTDGVLSSSGITNISNGTLSNISTIPAASTTAGENWTCEAKSYDGFDNETDWNNASIIILSLPVTAGAAGGGGGGGGATRVIPGGVNYSVIECIESWSCGPWSPCIAGERSRICIDLNICRTDKFKPIEIEKCIVPEEVEKPKEIKTVIETPAPVKPAFFNRLFNSIKSKLFGLDKCSIITLITYLILIISALSAIVYFITRNYFEKINKYIAVSYVLVAVAALLLLMHYSACQELLIPGIISITAIIAVFVLDILISAVIKHGPEYWARIQHKERYEQFYEKADEIEEINRRIRQKLERLSEEKRTFKKSLHTPRIRIRKTLRKTLDNIERFNSYLKNKVKGFKKEVSWGYDKVSSDIRMTNKKIFEINRKIEDKFRITSIDRKPKIISGFKTKVSEEFDKISRSVKKNKFTAIDIGKKSYWDSAKTRKNISKMDSELFNINRKLEKELGAFSKLDKRIEKKKKTNSKIKKNDKTQLKSIDKFNSYLKKQIKEVKKAKQ